MSKIKVAGFFLGHDVYLIVNWPLNLAGFFSTESSYPHNWPISAWLPATVCPPLNPNKPICHWAPSYNMKWKHVYVQKTQCERRLAISFHTCLFFVTLSVRRLCDSFTNAFLQESRRCRVGCTSGHVEPVVTVSAQIHGIKTVLWKTVCKSDRSRRK